MSFRVNTIPTQTIAVYCLRPVLMSTINRILLFIIIASDFLKSPSQCLRTSSPLVRSSRIPIQAYQPRTHNMALHLRRKLLRKLLR